MKPSILRFVALLTTPVVLSATSGACQDPTVPAFGACLLEPCPNGVCEAHQVKPGYCYIDFSCFNAQQTIPGDECMWCEPTKSQLVAVGRCGAGERCQAGGVCVPDEPDAADATDATDVADADDVGAETADAGPDGDSLADTSPSICQAVDLLFVVDNSTSMCGKQFELAAALDSFRQQLDPGIRGDLRMAVTSVDMQCDASEDDGIFGSKGAFNTHPATAYPAACYAKSWTACKADAECESPGEEGQWKCTTENLDICITNPNGSVNTTCRWLCDSDAACQARYGVDYRCLQPGGSDDSGCVQQPLTSGCPDSLPPILAGDDVANLATCATNIGVYANKCFKYEQGLGAALAATDPSGPNSGLGFPRPGAHLVVVFVSDEDDCSTAPGESFAEDFYNTCAYEPTTDDGGILLPVAEVAATLRTRVDDPTKVMVAVVVGDALGADKPAERTAFVASKTDPRTCHQKSYICQGPSGPADWGSRYQLLAAEFGAKGAAHNMCAGVAPAMDAIAAQINAGVASNCGATP